MTRPIASARPRPRCARARARERGREEEKKRRREREAQERARQRDSDSDSATERRTQHQLVWCRCFFGTPCHPPRPASSRSKQRNSPPFYQPKRSQGRGRISGQGTLLLYFCFTHTRRSTNPAACASPSLKPSWKAMACTRHAPRPGKPPSLRSPFAGCLPWAALLCRHPTLSLSQETLVVERYVHVQRTRLAVLC